MFAEIPIKTGAAASITRGNNKVTRLKDPLEILTVQTSEWKFEQ
jgi:hypothetical protein